jgi:TRAP-type C4-dicarboxylate transport system substrate-binding protein
MKTRTVRIIAAALVLLSAAFSAHAGGEKERVWKFGHVRPEGTSTDVDAKTFVEAVQKASNGKLKINIFAASQLGNYTVVQERVSVGDVEMQLAPFGTNVTKALGITSAPYFVSTWAEVKTMFARNGKLMAAVDKMLEKERIKILALYPKYFGGIALAKEPKEPKNPNVSKGLKIRVPGIKSFEKTAETLGYLATPIAFSEAFTAMQTGIVDGLIGSGAEGYWASFRDLTKYYLPVNSHFEMWFLYMNLDLYNKLSQEEKKVLNDAAAAMEKARFESGPKETQEFEQLLAGNGVTIIPYSDAELTVLADKVKSEVWPQIKGDYGADLFDSLTK